MVSLFSWQYFLYLPEPFVGEIPVVSFWLVLGLKPRFRSGSSIAARSSFQIDEWSCALLDKKTHWNKTGLLGTNQLSMDKETEEEWKWRRHLPYKLWSDVWMCCSVTLRQKTDSWRWLGCTAGLEVIVFIENLSREIMPVLRDHNHNFLYF